MSESFRLDDYAVTAIVDKDCFEIDLARMFPTASADAMAAHAWLAPHHYDPTARRIRLGMHSFLIRTGTLNILVDMCVGEHKERPAHPAWHRQTGSRFLPGLAAAGLTPDDIDLVFCTHLHADHVGWNTRLVDGRWVPTFPRARYAVSAQELAFWQAEQAASPQPVNHGAFLDSVLPIVEAGLTMPVAPGDRLDGGLAFVDLAGHTPGHMGLEIVRPGARALFCGDAIHSPVQLPYPDWSSAFCDDAQASARTRRAMLERTADEGVLLCPAHFRHARWTRIRRAGNGFAVADL